MKGHRAHLIINRLCHEELCSAGKTSFIRVSSESRPYTKPTGWSSVRL